MQVLNDKDDALYAKLVRLAGGDSGIVMRVLSNPSRDRVSLTTVIEEIETHRRHRASLQRAVAGGSGRR